ncbi:MAG: lipid-A-disaccharide synthase [Cyanobacteria bacterium]|nr:lipid-A-disaccharide synthase [Cyanobacteria bacterium CG_2015-16_32_12]NCO78069.1 lipid-A-disaccharide synthase [Cyanobacteria bacterium CG_2015-22_32_23]NCQ04809.1 lipid-A-disaccharide synthase [Cyanobacteria bacterium CG_2015-09_32_10]NCQ41677.1 lipid-A-disaccharide synthase [Cyanobacteria bacterium CG_2015-04_32_10]NCS83822.1 lipid-A-disaccharide synthase [Cyanobacteria bacterium CG_2015-02_32_10]
MNKFDIVILSNGPGEITTWVLPVVKKIRANLSISQDNVRISLILSPCPHSTGNEVKIASQWQEINRIQSANNFLTFLLFGKTQDNWDWYSQGLIIFLGGDQFFTLVIAKRLGYQSLIYAEWEARWYRYINYFAVMNQSVIDKIPIQFHNKCTVVGDLMADINIINQEEKEDNKNTLKIGLLPGSKSSKLTQGVPFLMAIAEFIKQKNSNIEFIIPVAPTIDTENLASYGDKKNNPLISKLGNVTGELINIENQVYLQTLGGVNIKLIKEFPCDEELGKCDICLTTVGANTAILGSLGIPMIVLLPIYQLEAMKSWDGLLGILANLPIFGDNFAKLINWIMVQYTVKNKKLYAWPNIWAKKEIVPELIGYLTVEEVSNLTLELLENKDKLKEIKNNLKEIRGLSGASLKIAKIVTKIIEKCSF